RYRPWCERAVVRTEGHAAGHVVEEAALDAIDVSGLETGPVAGGDAPTRLADMLEPERVADRILLLDERRAPAVFEVVGVVVAHEAIADAAKVAPDVRQLVGEERSRIEVGEAVDRLPLVAGAPGVVRDRVDGMGRRTEREEVEQERL